MGSKSSMSYTMGSLSLLILCSVAQLSQGSMISPFGFLGLGARAGARGTGSRVVITALDVATTAGAARIGAAVEVVGATTLAAAAPFTAVVAAGRGAGIPAG